MLYVAPLSVGRMPLGDLCNIVQEDWSRRVGLNHRPTVYETVALPLSYAGLCKG